MKKTFFSTLVLLTIGSTLAHAGNSATSTQLGSGSAVATIEQSGHGNVSNTNQVTDNYSATDTISVNQYGNDNKAYVSQNSVDNGTGIGNTDVVNQHGHNSSATIATKGENNTTTLNQYSDSSVASAKTEGFNNSTTINQTGENYFGADKAYSTILGSNGNTVNINQGLGNPETSANIAKSNIMNNSYGNMIDISQDGAYGNVSVSLNNAWENSVNVNQDNDVWGSGNLVDVKLTKYADYNNVDIYQAGEGNSALVDVNNSAFNNLDITQEGTSNKAIAKLNYAYDSVVDINQVGNGHNAMAIMNGVNNSSIVINQSN